MGKWPFVGGVALPDSAMVLPECSIHLLVQLGLDRREQGFGRLVRTAEDRGRVVILDPRVLTKPYGRVFLDSLPPAKLVIEPYA